MMVHLSPEFTPAYLKGIVIHPENALKFDFIIYKGDQPLSDAKKKEEYTKLTKYFLASLAIPDEDQWVNLSPYEKERIIKDDFGKTEMGRDLLAQDYLLKQITASLIYPQDKLGKEFWNRVYAQAQKQFGTTNIPVNTFNKVWILPDDALIYEKGSAAYVLKNHLRVMLEEDYLATIKGTSPFIAAAHVSKKRETSPLLMQGMLRKIILPELEREVNEDKNFAPLRQVYSGMLLATWYKRALKDSFLSKIYANKAKVKGVDQDPKTNEKIYHEYLSAYKKGVFNFIKEDVDKYTNETIPRKYFSGGMADYAQAAQDLGMTTVVHTIHDFDPAQSSRVKGELAKDEDLAAISLSEINPNKGAASAHKAVTAPTLAHKGQTVMEGRTLGNVPLATAPMMGGQGTKTGAMNARSPRDRMTLRKGEGTGLGQAIIEDKRIVFRSLIPLDRGDFISKEGEQVILDRNGIQQERLREEIYKPMVISSSWFFTDMPIIGIFLYDLVHNAALHSVVKGKKASIRVRLTSYESSLNNPILKLVISQPPLDGRNWGIIGGNASLSLEQLKNTRFRKNEGLYVNRGQAYVLYAAIALAKKQMRLEYKRTKNGMTTTLWIRVDHLDMEKFFGYNLSKSTANAAMTAIRKNLTEGDLAMLNLEAADPDPAEETARGEVDAQWIESHRDASAFTFEQFLRHAFPLRGNTGLRVMDLGVEDSHPAAFLDMLMTNNPYLNIQSAYAMGWRGFYHIIPGTNFEHSSTRYTFETIGWDEPEHLVGQFYNDHQFDVIFMNAPFATEDMAPEFALEANAFLARGGLLLIRMYGADHQKMEKFMKKALSDRGFMDHGTIHEPPSRYPNTRYIGGDYRYIGNPQEASIPDTTIYVFSKPVSIGSATSTSTPVSPAMITLRKHDAAMLHRRAFLGTSLSTAVMMAFLEFGIHKANGRPIMAKVIKEGSPEWDYIQGLIAAALEDPTIKGIEKYENAIKAFRENAKVNLYNILDDMVSGIAIDSEQGVGMNLAIIKKWMERSHENPVFKQLVYGILIKEGAQVLFARSSGYKDYIGKKKRLQTQGHMQDEDIKSYMAAVVEGEAQGYRLESDYFNEANQGLAENIFFDLSKKYDDQRLKSDLVQRAAYVILRKKGDLLFREMVFVDTIAKILDPSVKQDFENMVGERVRNELDHYHLEDPEVMDVMSFLNDPHYYSNPAQMGNIKEEHLGGIDMNAANLNLKIKRDGKGVPLPLAQQDMALLSHMEGLEPEILSIRPASETNLYAQLK